MPYMKSWDLPGKLDFQSQVRQEACDLTSKLFREFDIKRINAKKTNLIDINEFKIPSFDLEDIFKK